MASSLKIGIIASEYLPHFGGMESYGKNLAAQFARMGYEVHMFVPDDAGGQEGIIHHKILSNNLIRDLPRLARYDMDRWLCINSSYLLLAFFKKEVYSVVHGNDFLMPWIRFRFPYLKKRFFWRLRVQMESVLLTLLRKMACFRVKKIFANSRFTAKIFVQKHRSAKAKTSVIHPGVENFYFDGHKPDVVNVDKTLLSVTRLTEINSRKNIRGIIELLAEFKDEYIFKYYVVGGGDELENLKEIVRDLKLSDRVFLVGKISYEKLREFYCNSDLFILVPKDTKKDVEGFGIVYIEANACGVPVLAKRGDGSIDSVKEGETGILVDTPEKEEIKQALRDFFENKYVFERKKMIAHAKQFTWDRVAAKFLEGMDCVNNVGV